MRISFFVFFTRRIHKKNGTPFFVKSFFKNLFNRLKYTLFLDTNEKRVV